MAHPSTLQDFLREEKKITEGEENPAELQCSSCDDIYPSSLAELTQGRCPACAIELFYGVVRQSVAAVLKDNMEQASCDYQTFHNKPEGRRVGLGKIRSWFQRQLRKL